MYENGPRQSCELLEFSLELLFVANPQVTIESWDLCFWKRFWFFEKISTPSTFSFALFFAWAAEFFITLRQLWKIRDRDIFQLREKHLKCEKFSTLNKPRVENIQRNLFLERGEKHFFFRVWKMENSSALFSSIFHFIANKILFFSYIQKKKMETWKMLVISCFSHARKGFWVWGIWEKFSRNLCNGASTNNAIEIHMNGKSRNFNL